MAFSSEGDICRENPALCNEFHRTILPHKMTRKRKKRVIFIWHTFRLLMVRPNYPLIMQEPRRILLIDDDPDHLILCNVTLRKRGYEVMALPGCENTDDLQEVMESFAPDLIFMDHDMHGICGADLARFLKSRPEYSETPIIYFSGRDDIVQLAKEAGADGYLRKPFESGSLIGMAESYLALS